MAGLVARVRQRGELDLHALADAPRLVVALVAATATEQLLEAIADAGELRAHAAQHDGPVVLGECLAAGEVGLTAACRAPVADDVGQRVVRHRLRPLERLPRPELVQRPQQLELALLGLGPRHQGVGSGMPCFLRSAASSRTRASVSRNGTGSAASGKTQRPSAS